MKKLRTCLIAIFTFLPLSSFSFTTCQIADSNFCHCFINNCASTFPAAECTYQNLVGIIHSAGKEKTCLSQGYITKSALQECENGLSYFQDHCK